MNREQAVKYLSFSGFSDEQIKAIEGAFTCEDCISALNRVMEYTYGMLTAEKAGLQHLIKSMLDDLPSVNPQKPNAGHCKDCKYFEYDSVARVDGVPLIVAHEICSKWGDGCKTSENGYCFLFEPKEGGKE